jgi:hypothetical protein
MEKSDVALSESLEHVALRGGIQEAHQQASFREGAALLLARRADLEHDIGLGPSVLLGDAGASLGVVLVWVGVAARTGLDDHLVLVGDELLDGVGDECDAPLALGPLPRHGNPHRSSLCPADSGHNPGLLPGSQVGGGSQPAESDHRGAHCRGRRAAG